VLARVRSEQGVAVLLSAHDMNPLLSVMDRIVYMAAGRAATGTTEQVIRTETLSELYGHHVDVIHVQGRILVVAGEESVIQDTRASDALVGLSGH
jgi:zinc/manganese transport system ATP-binding protein